MERPKFDEYVESFCDELDNVVDRLKDDACSDAYMPNMELASLLSTAEPVSLLIIGKEALALSNYPVFNLAYLSARANASKYASLTLEITTRGFENGAKNEKSLSEDYGHVIDILEAELASMGVNQVEDAWAKHEERHTAILKEANQTFATMNATDILEVAKNLNDPVVLKIARDAIYKLIPTASTETEKKQIGQIHTEITILLAACIDQLYP